MIKTKNLTFAAGSGFVLSFLISIISTHNFGRSLLRGLLFSLLFGGLAAGIAFLKEKFLDSGNESNPLTDVGMGKAPKTVGNKIDITVSDDNLTDDGEGVKFSLSGTNKERIPAEGSEPDADESGMQKVSSVDTVPMASSENAVENSSSQQSDTSFKPVQLGQVFVKETTPSTESPAAESPVSETASSAFIQPMDAAAARKSAARAEREAGIKEVGELPDIGAFIPVAKETSDDDSIIEDSDFAAEGDPDISFAKEKNTGDSALTSKDHDSDTMVKAIRTLLSRD